jgi:hypothetical protein
MTRLALVLTATLAAAAAAWAAPGPVVTRGSAALPDGCGPAAVAGIVSIRTAQDQRTPVYVAAIPNRALGNDAVSVEAGVAQGNTFYAVTAVVDCAQANVVAWSEKRTTRFRSPGPCPEPKGWQATTVVACAGLPSAWETASDFTVKTTQQSTGRCGAVSARKRVVSLFHALDYATAYPFALNFTSNGTYLPYTASVKKPLAGRLRISIYAAGQMAHVDGWTATSLLGPLDRTAKTAVYRVGLVNYVNGNAYGAGYAHLTLDCASGLIAAWAGPPLPVPPPS